jgi:tetratricopeptide (TPR) repeat protein
MSESRKGAVVTFYSYKGGTGRTMALANVAWILASAGQRVLVADWDLEAPGLPRFFQPFIGDNAVKAAGVIDLIRRYEDEVMQDRPRPENWVEGLARLSDYVIPIRWPFEGGGSLDLLTAGRQNSSYATSLSRLDWDTFYERLGGGHFLDALGEVMRRDYDYTLIDSRTGFSDVADICTQHLPDVLVDCFTLSDQGINGAADVAKAVERFGRAESGHRIRILPVAMRVDAAEKVKADAGRARAMRAFPGLPDGLTNDERLGYFNKVEIPYQAFYAYEETLATFDVPGNPASLLAAYERLTETISNGAVHQMRTMDERLRNTWQRRFERSLTTAQNTILLEYAAADQVWAEWAESVLVQVGLSVEDPGPIETLPRFRSLKPGKDVLAIVSANYLSVTRQHPEPPPDTQTLSLLVGATRARDLDPRARGTAAVAAGVPEKEARRRLLISAGLMEPLPSYDETRLARFPDTEPQWFQAPARNAMFTGRAAELRRLRESLTSRSRAVVLPVTLHGMGGIGKTQLALEYVYRFASSYDLIWWIAADPPQFIDASLADLADKLHLPPGPTAAASARTVLEALRLGTRTRRWLLVFDNAADPRAVEPFVPKGREGHVLITSRNPDWGAQANPVEVDVFQPEESVAHLRRRSKAITAGQAERVGRALGDLPIAVAAAGALLAESGADVQDFLDQVEARDPERRSSAESSWDATWDLSLDRLLERSTGAYRLLEICSTLGPEIALDLVYSDQLAAALVPFDALVSDRMMRAALVQQINRLALLKLDQHAKQIHIHRLVQAAVRRRMSPQKIEATRHEAHLVLARCRPTGEPDDPETWPRFRMLWPHLEVTGAVSCGDESVRQLLIDRVRYLRRRGDLKQGLAFGRRVAGAWQELLDRGQAEVPAALRRQLLHLTFNLANILRDQADFTGALALDEDVLGAQRELLGDRHSHTLMTAGGRAADLRALGDYADALRQEEVTYQAWLADFGEDHARTLMAANNLATSLRAVGDFRRARAIDADVAERRRVVLGAEHPYTLHSQSCLGRDLREAGEYALSVDLLTGVAAAAATHLGEEALDTLHARSNLAASLRSAGRTAEAHPLLSETYATLLVRFGSDSPSTMACRLNWAANLLAEGDAEAAFTELEAVTRAYEESLEPDNPFTLVCVSNLSAAYRANGRIAEALALAERAAGTCLARLGERHPYYLAAATNLVICRFEAGQAAGQAGQVAGQAGQVPGLAGEMRRLVELMSGELGEQHPDTLSCQGNLALLTSRLSEASSAAPDAPGGPGALQRVIDALAGRLGPEHPSVTSLREGRLLYRMIDPHDPY